MNVSDTTKEKPVNQKELLSFLGIGKTTLNKLKKNDSIPYFKAGKRILYQPTEVLNALKSKSL